MPNTKQQLNNLEEKPPIVVILGHVDHGKTKLLDYIRKTNVAEGEAGGITQHIGAYEIIHNNKKITFLDTPGHEAFSKMRSRGAKVADLAILVVSAEEGVKPQTIEAILHIREAEIPFIVALNKIDKPEANPQKVKQQLAEQGILFEDWGGDVPIQEISAKTGRGIPELIELIILVAEMKELKAEKNKPAKGVIIESHIDSQKGVLFTCLIQEGNLKIGDYLISEKIFGKVKMMQDFLKKPISSASFSSPVIISGFSEIPAVGEVCLAIADKKSAEKMIKNIEEKEEKLLKDLSQKEIVQAPAEDKKTLKIILKTDVSGSKEAIEGLINSLNFTEISTKILKSEIGDVQEADLKLASSGEAVVVAFKVGMPELLKKTAERQKTRVIASEIIYDLIERIKEEMSKELPPIIERIDYGKLQTLATFKQAKGKLIVGGKVIAGKIKKGIFVDIVRNKIMIETGKIIQLQQDKQETEEVSLGRECGMMINVKNLDFKIQVSDILEFYENKEKIRSLQ